eukprot:TRINITY_DN1877_c0_g1_i3.p1 TRINITY_DN1877_c0_g1~~TRINITY_DN1877_c0_g1_i3.p1  ORF type:complete len:339 (+),score=63.02 TRINITY_DN1877_c0_g1_i3:49-1065(+)
MALTLGEIVKAAARIKAVAVRTPLLEVPSLNQLVGGGARIFIKAETLQRTGSFKFRGASNRILQLTEAEKKVGVVAFSSGNHAQGVAHAAQICSVPAVIVMPSDAPAIKIANTRSYGAEVVLYDRIREDREAIARKISDERKCVVVPPYDDFTIMAGQGTVGLEIMEQLRQLNIQGPDVVLVPASGGGLVAGISIAIKSQSPSSTVFCVEPAGFDDHGRSLSVKQRVSNPSDSSATTLCDALMAPTPGEKTFSVNKNTLSGGLSVTDAEIERAMLEFFLHAKLVVEPGGAVGLAAILAGKVDVRGKNVVVVASGGNVDPTLFQQILSRQNRGKIQSKL